MKEKPIVISSESLKPKTIGIDGFNLTVENDLIFLQKYGLATALYSTAEHVLLETIKLKGGLHKSNAALVKKLLEHKTLGVKIELVKTLPVSEELKTALETAAKDRNMLAHGVTSSQGEKLGLMHKGEFHDLSGDALDTIIFRARNFGALVLREFMSAHDISSPKQNNG